MTNEIKEKIVYPPMCRICTSVSCCVNGGWRLPCDDSKLKEKYPIKGKESTNG